MTIERMLFAVGLVLLSAAALVGLKQHRERERPESFARWRVVHAGGTSGAVQLLALGTAFGHLGVQGTFVFWIGSGVAVGAAFAVPAYLGLPFVVMLNH